MNRKKWREKFEHKDSRRFLKQHEPYYSAKFRQGCMPPVRQWIHVARDIMRAYPPRMRYYNDWMDNRPVLPWPADRIALGILCRDAQVQIDAVDAAIREEKKLRNGERLVKMEKLMYWEHMPMEEARKAVNIDRTTADRWDYYFLRAVAWHAGYHYNHVGKNRFGNTRKGNRMNR